MSGWKNVMITFGVALSVSLIAAAVSVMLVSRHDSRLQFDLLNAVCGKAAEQEPEAGKIISAALKECAKGTIKVEKDFLSAWGYQASDFSGLNQRRNILFAAIGFLTGAFLFFFTF